MPTVEPLAVLTPADQEAIIAPLGAFSRQRGFAWAPVSLALVLKDEHSVVGGLTGGTQFGRLRINILSVAEHLRGGGWGRRLVEEAEKLAVRVGCHSAWVDTFRFQSPGFYRRLGYAVFGELPDYPTGQTRYFLSKRLVAAPGKMP
ncbi:GNAT family N-acetyltransferase [Limnoglobus roseus]|uniref:N-acetyltransferase n=1 Tax=Limnoglobus roseus TaxID=2598579 RepID=A0A5C1AFZ8_9BACT|nr:GNAT family N-acetyltransferase [Limnoglobus roseus]QEL16672.1 N-acetyltransferase [Limnoglobus roseus]